MGNFILNAVWFLTLGAPIALVVVLVGAILCCTVIGIPLGVVCFKQSMACAFPFGRSKPAPGGVTIINTNKG